METETYKFNPDDFAGMLGIKEDLTGFYEAREKYLCNKTTENKFVFLGCAESLFFSIKHRALEGFITQTEAFELREHMEGLLNDV
ncbi:MAG: hypothetical protein LBI54_10300 [Lachnospiraceae bacterium]|nr:hypothetical protein [Lachnospiraceae bacterium]